MNIRISTGISFKKKEIISLHDITEGDVSYLSPEVFYQENLNKIDEKSDVFSLGLSILEILFKIELPKNGKLWREMREENFDISSMFNSINNEKQKEYIDLIEKMPKAKFDETVELHVKLGVDSKHADQQVRGTVVLPNGTGKTQRVLVFAKGDKAKEAEAAGADFVGGEELIPKIEKENWFDYDVVVATPDMMGVVGRLGRVLGPKGLMPNPKSGTVTMDVAKAIAEIKSGKVEYRLDKSNIIHLAFGKMSFGTDKLVENYEKIIWITFYLLYIACNNIMLCIQQ